MVICPCCRNVTDIPIIFKGLRQYVFSYIWENPNCTTKEINKHIFAGNATVTTISAHLSYIRKGLRYHDYALVGKRTKEKTKQGARPKQYKIIRPATKIAMEGIENALT